MIMWLPNAVVRMRSDPDAESENITSSAVEYIMEYSNTDDYILQTEIHWYEQDGIGKVDYKIKEDDDMPIALKTDTKLQNTSGKKHAKGKKKAKGVKA